MIIVIVLLPEGAMRPYHCAKPPDVPALEGPRPACACVVTAFLE